MGAYLDSIDNSKYASLGHGGLDNKNKTRNPNMHI